MKGYTLPCTLSLVFVMSITVEGCQETGEIKVNSNDKYITVCVWICNISLISWWRFSHPGNINQVLYQNYPLFSVFLELNGRSVDSSFSMFTLLFPVYIFFHLVQRNKLFCQNDIFRGIKHQQRLKNNIKKKGTNIILGSLMCYGALNVSSYLTSVIATASKLFLQTMAFW